MPELHVALHVGQLLQRAPGGIGRYVVELSRALENGGTRVVPFATGGCPAGLSTDHYVDLGRPRGQLRYELWHYLRWPPLRLDADVVHAPSLAVPPPGHMPLVVTVHDVAFLRLPQYFTVHGLRFHERGLRLARRDARAVVVPSQFVADELTSEGFEPERIYVAPHGVRPPGDREPAETTSIRERLGLPERFLLFVGTLEPRKGIGTLLRGYSRFRRDHPDVALAIVGARGWGKLPDFDRPGVVRLGEIDDDDLDALYRTALSLAYPSAYEGFGLPALEAMVRGCPVVVSDAASLREVVAGAGITVPVGDAEAFAGALAEIAGDPARREALAESGRERAARFTWDVSVDAHLRAYEAAAGTQGSRATPS